MNLFSRNDKKEGNGFVNSLLILIFVLIPLYVAICFVLFINKKEAVAVTLDYTGSPSVVISHNKPGFTQDEITDVSYEEYGELDELGRCTYAIACIGKDIMPTEGRGSIGEIIPTGWVQNRYPGIVDSEPPFLYNRCHMIGYKLTGENANVQNLITGTRYMNVEGMLPYEDEVADYILSTGNHVMYRVTPVFVEDNLLCNGVQMEAYSVEDNGQGVCFNVFCFNVQPGITIDYADGNNNLNEALVAASSELSYGEATREASIQNEELLLQEADYVANKNTMKFHYPYCESVGEIYEGNKLYYKGPREELIEQGYVPCKRCNP